MASALSLKGALHAEAANAGGGPQVAQVTSPFAMPDGVKKAKKWDEQDALGNARTTRFDVTALNLHTRELYAVPLSGGVLAAPEGLDRFLRCRVTGRTTPMRREPFLVALQAAKQFGRKRIQIVSGFRSPKFNEHLRKKGHSVATRSHHTLGEALDFRIPGVPARRLAKAVAAIHRGGIGTYVKNDFVHVDVGRDRRWGGQ